MEFSRAVISLLLPGEASRMSPPFQSAVESRRSRRIEWPKARDRRTPPLIEPDRRFSRIGSPRVIHRRRFHDSASVPPHCACDRVGIAQGGLQQGRSTTSVVAFARVAAARLTEFELFEAHQRRLTFVATRQFQTISRWWFGFTASSRIPRFDREPANSTGGTFTHEVTHFTNARIPRWLVSSLSSLGWRRGPGRGGSSAPPGFPSPQPSPRPTGRGRRCLRPAS